MSKFSFVIVEDGKVGQVGLKTTMDTHLTIYHHVQLEALSKDGICSSISRVDTVLRQVSILVGLLRLSRRT